MRERTCQVSESGFPRALATTPEKPTAPWATESRVASSATVGPQASLARPAGRRQSRHASRSTLARASSPSESSDPSSRSATRAVPASGVAFPSAGSSDASPADPPPPPPPPLASQATSGSIVPRLSASKSSASSPRESRLQPSDPAPVVTRPARVTRSESTYSRRSANRTLTAPESRLAPASCEGSSNACTVPTGGTALSPATSPRNVKVRREGGTLAPPPSHRARSTSRATTFRPLAP